MLDLAFDKLDGGALTGPQGFGRVTLVVNTASACGYTPQYAELESLWRQYQARGLVVLGVPCNDFGAQEPGGAQEIRRFCESRYSVSFPLAAKAAILDLARRQPFYRALAELIGEDQLPRWNFHKYLVSAQGELLDAWPSKVSPLSPEVIAAIEDALA